MESTKLQLSQSVRKLKGIGPEKERHLLDLGIQTLADLFYCFPRRYEDRFPVVGVSEITGLKKECVWGVIKSRSVIRLKNGSSLFRAVISEGESQLFVVFYRQPYLLQSFKPDARILVYGLAERQGKHWQMAHPEYEISQTDAPEATAHLGRIAPIYSLTEDVSQKFLRQIMYRHVQENAQHIQDPLDDIYRDSLELMGLKDSFRHIHFPDSLETLKKAYERLVFDEFFGLQLLVEQKRMSRLAQRGIFKQAPEDKELEVYLRSLPFDLTAGQRSAIQDISRDLQGANPMNRLIQGDVGSGKTVVASAALFIAYKSGFQSALMAPTEVLAQQLFFSLTQLLGGFGVRLGYLAQAVPPMEKQLILNALSSGALDAVVGTHSLIEQNIKFHKLGLAIVDEQHKFGVIQRLALKQKASRVPHFLLMTATPIPRTLSMTIYGDMEISVMADKPSGRLPVKTLWLPEKKREEFYQWMARELGRGFQAFVVCPMIENTSEMAISLSGILARHKVELLHGRMKSPEKTKIMQLFKSSEIKVLVSTTVIEVGVDVPNACFMVIENADRFGLAQLHQLRGRVGRGQGESYCIIFSDTQNPEAIERLSVFRETDDGFKIAEKDMEARGSGERLGSKQHGLPQLRIGDLGADTAIHDKAKDLAKRLVRDDPTLSKPNHAQLKRMIAERYSTLMTKQNKAGDIA